MLVNMQDMPHIIKRLGNWTAKQEGTNRPKEGEFLISKYRCLRAVKAAKNLPEVEAFLNRKVDTQCVPIIENFFYNHRLRRKLIAHGHWRDACWLKILGEGYQVFEMSQLTHQERNRRLHRMRRMLAAVFHTDLHSMQIDHASDKLKDGLYGFPRAVPLILMELSSAHVLAVGLLPAPLAFARARTCTDCESCKKH